jgi:two-component system NtrC family sensor kinase
MNCPRCQQKNPSHAKFCLECATPLRAVAPSYAEVTSALTEAAEQQAATAEILRVISSSPNDVQPVFDAIVQSALRLLEGVGANVARLVGEELHLAAFTTTTGQAGNSAISAVYPMPISGWNIAARAVRARAPEYLAYTETVDE